MSRRSERREHLLALRSLSSLQPIYSVERSLAAIEVLGAGESSRFLDSLRMRTLVGRRLGAVQDPIPAVRECLAALTPTVDRLRHMHETLEANLARLDSVAVTLGLAIFGGKGISAHATYIDHSVRDFNDIDIFVRDRTEATALSRTLRNDFGYRYQKYELPWFKIDLDDALVYGQTALVAPEGDPDLLNVDIHFGDYSVRHASRLSITDSFGATSPGLHMMAPEENIACIVNNAAGDYFVTAKDTNDLLMAFAIETFDVDRLITQLRGSHLDAFFGFIARTLRESAVLTPLQDRRLRAVATPRTLEPAPRADTADWNRRCIGTTMHAFRAGRRNGLVPALRVSASAFSYYHKRLALSVAPSGRHPAPDPVEYNPWTCVRLVPLDLAADLLPEQTGAAVSPGLPTTGSMVASDPDFERFDTRAGTYLRIEDEFFVATVDYRLDADVIRQATAASARSR